MTSRQNWKITIQPNKTGVAIETLCDEGDNYADQLSQVIHQSVVEFQSNPHMLACAEE